MNEQQFDQWSLISTFPLLQKYIILQVITCTSTNHSSLNFFSV